MTLVSVVRGLLFLVIGLFVAAVSSCVLIASYRPAYDRQHPEYERYARAFAAARQKYESAGEVDDRLDLSSLNGGDWKVACVFGGYTRPLEHMQRLGASVSDMDRLRLTEAGTRGFRLGQVEEFEMMIAFIDHQDRAHFIHFESGIGSPGQYFEKCISRPDTTMELGDP